MASDRDGCHPEECEGSVREHQVVTVDLGIASALDPTDGPCGDDAAWPSSCHAPGRVVDAVEGLLADDMVVVITPTRNRSREARDVARPIPRQRMISRFSRALLEAAKRLYS